MSSRIIRSLARSLTLVAAAVLIRIGSAVAADSAQEQARQVLLGATTVVSADVQRTARAVGPEGDAQEQARRALLGVTAQTPARPQPGTFTVSENRSHGDAQALAQQVLLGRRGGLGE